MEGGNLQLPFPEDQNKPLFTNYMDQPQINERSIGDYQLVQFAMNGESIEIEAQSESLLLIIAGKPIKEPIVSWGPYVMNTQSEIMEAMRDYQMGKMGILT